MRLFLRCVSLTDRLLCISNFTYLFRRNITTYYFKSQPVASLNKPNASRVYRRANWMAVCILQKWGFYNELLL